MTKPIGCLTTRPTRLSDRSTGDAHELLKNSAYLRGTASKLRERGIVEVEQTWGGWVGQYQKAIQEHLPRVREKERERWGPQRALINGPSRETVANRILSARSDISASLSQLPHVADATERGYNTDPIRE